MRFRLGRGSSWWGRGSIVVGAFHRLGAEDGGGGEPELSQRAPDARGGVGEARGEILEELEGGDLGVRELGVEEFDRVGMECGVAHARY